MENRDIRVLVLDDDQDDTFLICDTIAGINDTSYEVSVFHSPAEAVEILKSAEFDVILCDYLMGKTSGLDFIETIRFERIDVPVILLTGMGDKLLDHAALAAGAADFLSKISVTAESLDRAIRYAIANAERQRLLHAVLNSVNAAVVVVDTDQAPTMWNPMFLELAKQYSQLAGIDVVEKLTDRLFSDETTLSVGDRILEKKLSSLPDHGMVVMLHDITEYVEALKERENANRRAAHLAMYCSLTGLPNRNAFAERIKIEVDRAKETGLGFYLLNLDLDKFKEINDVYGHRVGDELLAEVCARMSACCEPVDYVARLGGDEFMAIQIKKSEDGEIPGLANRISRAVNGTYSLSSAQVHSGISIGVASYPEHGDTAEELMSNADIAMYRAKADPNAQISAFDANMDKVVRETRFLAHELKTAIGNNHLSVNYQPQANVSDGQIIGFEALARWRHADLGMISPARFIPIAEDHGLIHQLSEQVLMSACKFAAEWTQPMKVAVNISAMQIRHTDLVQLVHSVLFKTGLPATRLELEVTESVLVDDFNRALQVVRSLKDLGASIALDDFGTGYASLSTLIAFPFDTIKIDRSFTENIEKSPQAAEVVRAIVGLGHNLNYRIIAEGVQKPEHVDFLSNLQCHEMQGFLIGAPISCDKVGRLIETGSSELEVARSA